VKSTQMHALLVLILISSSAFPQASRGTSARAEKGWKQFYAGFVAALKKRDRAALKTMLPPRFDNDGDGDYSRDDWIRLIDKDSMWQGLQRQAALGTKRTADRPPTRVTNDDRPGSLYFLFGKDGRWRWAGLVGD
jgi:hypothetical protein